MEGLKPIREGIEKLPQAITFPTTQPLGEASGKEDPLDFGKIAKEYLNRPIRDTTFGIREEEGLYYIGNKQATIGNNNIIIGDEKFIGTPGLWELIMAKNPVDYSEKDYNNYKRLMIKTNALHRYYDPKNTYPRTSDSYKWIEILRPIWYGNEEEYEGEGVVVIPSDPNALLERFDLLLASQDAGHTGVRNELVSICDELRRQEVINNETYKKLNSIIKK